MEESYGQTKMLMNVGGVNTGSDIIKALLTSTKMQKTEPVEVNILSESKNQPIVFQIELGDSVKSEFSSGNENIIQDIPVTYLMANNSNLTHSVAPLTYVLSRDALPDTTGYCTVEDSAEPQKLIFVQEIDSSATQTMYSVPEAKFYAVKESQTNKSRYPEVWTVDQGEHIASGIKWICDGKSEKSKNTKNEDESPRSKTKVEKKTSPNKKPVNKKKMSKLKTKPKACGKAVVKKLTKSKLNEEEKPDDKEADKKNLFELTKLEDNVDQVAERLKIGCECTDSNCFDELNPDDVFRHRLNIADLTKAEHDMYLMGVIMASIHNLEETCRHKERIRIRSCYAYKGKKVCLTAFLYLQHVTLYQMKRLRSHLKNHGVSPRIHGNRGRKPANTFSLEIYRRASNFFQNYIEKHCVKAFPNTTAFSLGNKISTDSMSGTHEPKTSVKGKKNTSYHLPPECTKRVVHGEYKTFCESFKPSQKVMKYSTFTNFLKKQFPNVKFHKREEKKPMKVEEWKLKEEKVEGCEDEEKKLKEEPGVDKSIQVDKTLVYVPTNKQVLMNDERMKLYDESEIPQPAFRVDNQIVVSSQSYSVTENAQYYAIGSNV